MRLPARRMLAVVEQAGFTVNATSQLGTLLAWVWATKN